MKMKILSINNAIILSLVLLAACRTGQQAPGVRQSSGVYQYDNEKKTAVLRKTGPYYSDRQAVTGKNGMVASAHPEASRVGVDILKAGGNAVDAAVAVQFALAVVYPGAGNIGGGGFMVFRDKTGQSYTLDYREKGPEKAHKDMYLDSAGNVIPRLSIIGPAVCRARWPEWPKRTGGLAS
jgi:gamma-glutamyltranspeptidase/glutathione hydrolase